MAASSTFMHLSQAAQGTDNGKFADLQKVTEAEYKKFRDAGGGK